MSCRAKRKEVLEPGRGLRRPNLAGMSSICKYCNKTELVFDNAFKSKTGKLIPLDKTSGLPHSCSDNPYNTKQQEQSGSLLRANSSQTNFQVSEVQQKELVTMNEKLDRLLNLTEQLLLLNKK
jgi:hypothetical protein